MFKWRVEQSSKKSKSLPKDLAKPGGTGRKEGGESAFAYKRLSPVTLDAH